MNKAVTQPFGFNSHTVNYYQFKDCLLANFMLSLFYSFSNSLLKMEAKPHVQHSVPKDKNATYLREKIPVSEKLPLVIATVLLTMFAVSSNTHMI